MLPPLTRRRFLKGVGVAGALLPIGCEPIGSEAEPRRLGRILVITADDLGWKDLSCYGNVEVQTPNIDRLAREGVSFDYAFDVTSSCSPSRATYITGQYPHTHGLTGLSHRFPELALPAGYQTLPALLQQAGFYTALEGKWDVANWAPVEGYGYDELLNSILLSLRIQSSQNALTFIDDHQGEPFYLELNFINTHRDVLGDFQQAAGFEVDPAGVTVPEYWALPQWPAIAEVIARYYSQLRLMDSMVGEVLDHLDRLGLTDSTLVVFVSDNGPPFPGNKTSLYDRGTGTPLIFRWPKGLPAGERRDHLCSTVDLTPTILDAIGLSTPTDMEGMSILGIASDGDAPPIRDAIFSEMTYHSSYIPIRAIRTRAYKYIRNYTDRPLGLGDAGDDPYAADLQALGDQRYLLPRPKEELYHLESDPNEQVNLIDDSSHAAALSDLRARLDTHMRDTSDPFLDAPYVIGS